MVLIFMNFDVTLVTKIVSETLSHLKICKNVLPLFLNKCLIRPFVRVSSQVSRKVIYIKIPGNEPLLLFQSLFLVSFLQLSLLRHCK